MLFFVGEWRGGEILKNEEEPEYTEATFVKIAWQQQPGLEHGTAPHTRSPAQPQLPRASPARPATLPRHSLAQPRGTAPAVSGGESFTCTVHLRGTEHCCHTHSSPNCGCSPAMPAQLG